MFNQGNICQPHRNVPGRGAEFDNVPLPIRFWAKVKKTKTCWIWCGSCNRGRGQINIDGKPKFASRVSWEMHNGPIPLGIKVLHKCDNPLCIRPSHLFLGTQTDNMRDCINKGRKALLTFEERSSVQRRPELRKSKSLVMSQTMWITNGKVRRRIKNDERIPYGWQRGRIVI